MALGSTIALADSAASVQTFNLIGYIPNGADYIEDDSTADLRRTISVRHSNVGKSQVKGREPVKRHLVQFIHNEYNATLGITEKFTINLTITKDAGSTQISSTEEGHVVAFAKNFLASATLMPALLRGES
jgi:hypothetical protein